MFKQGSKDFFFWNRFREVTDLGEQLLARNPNWTDVKDRLLKLNAEHDAVSVSYTHLDVYKRQTLPLSILSARWPEFVSYRQATARVWHWDLAGYLDWLAAPELSLIHIFYMLYSTRIMDSFHNKFNVNAASFSDLSVWWWWCC